MKKQLLLLAAIATLGLPVSTLATPWVLNGTSSRTPSPSDLNDLDHHSVYTWRFDNVSLAAGQRIVSVKLKFTNIRNWDALENVLHLHLLDTAKNAGVSSFIDDPNDPQLNLINDFINTRYHLNPSWLVTPGTAGTFLKDKSFTTTAVNYTYAFSQTQITSLAAYIANGDFALGFDPDCHFWNDGISLEIITGPVAVPEPATLALLGTGLMSTGFYLRRRRKVMTNTEK